MILPGREDLFVFEFLTPRARNGESAALGVDTAPAEPVSGEAATASSTTEQPAGDVAVGDIERQERAAGPARPSNRLPLGGGAARGFAHIGGGGTPLA